MKIVALSDTHCQIHKVKVPDGDLLLHAGDLTFKGDVIEISQELRALGNISKKFKYGCILICGNHDWLGERNPSIMKQMCLDEGLIYLDHSSIQIGNMNIFGSAYTPEFCNWAFNVPRGEKLKEKWTQIPDNVDILITHGPPMGIRDEVPRYNHIKKEWGKENVGCQDLADKIKDLKNLKLHVFGHIHNGYGLSKIDGVNYINTSVCTEEYRPINSPIVIEL